MQAVMRIERHSRSTTRTGWHGATDHRVEFEKPRMQPITYFLVAALAFTVIGCAPEPPKQPEPRSQKKFIDDEPVAITRDPHKRALFGDLHVHTSWSTDAFLGGNRVGPRDAYRFARGEAVELPSGIVTQLAVPLDFTAITDHAEGFDVIAVCTDQAHSQYDSDACENLREPDNLTDYFVSAFERGIKRPAPRNEALCGSDETGVDVCIGYSRVTWERTQAVAEEFDEPGTFTALIGYEFSSLVREFGMLHRNVIFRGTDVIPHAISSHDVRNQADFFAQMDAACQPPCEVLTIPHNSNYSWGLMFSRTDEDGSAYTAADFERRARIDRLAEVTQQKGESECQTGVGTTDEDCGFEKIFEPCAPGQFGRCANESSFLRNALLNGIQLASEGQTNPFKLGMIGSTDTHASDPGNTNPRNRFAQASNVLLGLGVKRLFEAAHPVVGPIRRTNTGGLAAVWAESNTREDIFDALRRREAFATSGTRIRVRFFAGDLPAEIGSQADALAIAYERGVPMGADLAAGLAEPRFWVWATQDPNGVSLDRIQVIKGWVEDGEQKHTVRDVVCAGGRVPGDDGRCAQTAASVDISTCEVDDSTGAAELQTTFVDTDFDAEQNAFYYVRVFENPSCRWTTWIANSVSVDLPDDVPATIQNRAWSSPIWTPQAAEER